MLDFITVKPLAIGLAIAVLLLGVQTWRVSSLKGDIVERDKQLGSLEARLSASNNSISELMAALAAKNAESEARAKAFTDAQNKARQQQEALARRFGATQAQIDALRANKEAGSDATPVDVIGALEGV
mgnify:CR=1 FL=1